MRDGYVTLEGAARDYGVVVVGDPEEDPEGLTLDLAATERCGPSAARRRRSRPVAGARGQVTGGTRPGGRTARGSSEEWRVDG